MKRPPTPAPQPAAQLDLWGSKEQRQLRAENEWLRGRLEAAKEEFRKLRLERDTWKNGNDTAAAILAKRTEECADLQRQVGRLQIALRCLESTVTLLQSLANASPQTQSPGLGREDLTQLLKIAHPDRWAQGQPATALAHELAIVINDMREKQEVLR